MRPSRHPLGGPCVLLLALWGACTSGGGSPRGGSEEDAGEPDPGGAGRGGSGGGSAGSAGRGGAGDATAGAPGTDAADAPSRSDGAAGSAGSPGTPDASSDRPPPDAAAARTDAGPAAFGYGGPSRCATANVLLCESFENGLDAATWTVTKPSSATLTVDELRPARGTRSLHIKANGVQAVLLRERKTFPIANNVLYGRMFVWLGDPVGNGHFSFAEGGGTGSRDVARFGGISQVLGVGSDGGPSGDWTDTDNKRIPAQQWLCLEFLYDGPTNSFKGWWDDEERPRLRSGMNRHAAYRTPQFTSLWFGWFLYNTPEPQELWIDEIAIDSKPIGCTK